MNNLLRLWTLFVISTTVLITVSLFLGFEPSITYNICLGIGILILLCIIVRSVIYGGEETESYWIIITSLLIAVSYFVFHDYAFDGNDYSVIASMATLYAKYHIILFPDAIIPDIVTWYYRVGEYDLPQFLNFYPAFLSQFYYFGWLEWMFVGNSILLLFLFLSLASILRSLWVSKTGTLLWLIFLASNYLFIYFFQKTFAELMLITTTMMWLALIFSEWKWWGLWFWLWVFALAIGPFIKIEAIPFVIISLFFYKFLLDEWLIASKKKWFTYLLLRLCNVSALFAFYRLYYQYLWHPYVIHNVSIILNKIGGWWILLWVLFSLNGLMFFDLKNIVNYITRFHRSPYILQIILLFALIVLWIEWNWIVVRSEYALTYSLNYFVDYWLFVLLILGLCWVYKLLQREGKDKTYGAYMFALCIYLWFWLYFLYNPGIGWRQPRFWRRFLVYIIPLLFFLTMYFVSWFTTSKKSKLIWMSIFMFAFMRNMLSSKNIMFHNEMKANYLSAKVIAQELEWKSVGVQKWWHWQKRLLYYLVFFSWKSLEFDKNIYTYYLSAVQEGKSNLLLVDDALRNPCTISWYVDDNARNLSVWRIRNLCYNSSFESQIQEREVYLLLQEMWSK